MKTYEIEISSLEFECIVGILDFERKIPQKIRIDLNICYLYEGDFLDYAQIRDDIVRLFKESEFGLLESALEVSLDFLREKYKTIKSCSMKISKPDILDNCIVSVASSF